MDKKKHKIPVVGRSLGFRNCRLSMDRPGYIIIAGTARSATNYIAIVFQQAGVDLRHERYGQDGISCFQIVPYLQFHNKAIILQQTREPLVTISSIQTARERTWVGIRYFLPCYDTENYTRRCMQYWYYWNIMLEGFPIYRYQVEQIEQCWDRICELTNTPNEGLPDVRKDVHTRQHSQWTWQDLKEADVKLYDKIRAMGEKLGY